MPTSNSPATLDQTPIRWGGRSYVTVPRLTGSCSGCAFQHSSAECPVISPHTGFPRHCVASERNDGNSVLFVEVASPGSEPLPNWRDLLGETRFADIPNEEFRVMRNTDWPEYGEPNSCQGCHFRSRAGSCTGPDIDDDAPCIYWAAEFDVCDVIFERVGAARTRKCGRKWPKFLPD